MVGDLEIDPVVVVEPGDPYVPAPLGAFHPEHPAAALGLVGAAGRQLLAENQKAR